MVSDRRPLRLRAVLALVVAIALGTATAWGPAPAGGAPAAPGKPAAIGAPAAPPAPANAGIESQFVSRINSLRGARGLSQLAVSGELTSVARRWSERMAQAGQISHNPNLGGQVGGAWTKLGENVGVGWDVPGLWDAFVASPSHYANLVDPAWTHVGVGVVVLGDGTIYTTHNFMAMPGGGPPPPPPPPPPTTPPASAPPATTPSAAPPTSAPAPADPAPTTTTEPPRPTPPPERVVAVLEPLRSLEPR